MYHRNFSEHFHHGQIHRKRMGSGSKKHFKIQIHWRWLLICSFRYKQSRSAWKWSCLPDHQPHRKSKSPRNQDHRSPPSDRTGQLLQSIVWNKKGNISCDICLTAQREKAFTWHISFFPFCIIKSLIKIPATADPLDGRRIHLVLPALWSVRNL